MNWIPVDRPIFYGYLIKYASLGVSLWYVVWIQSLLLSYLIYRFLSIFWSRPKLYIYYIVSIFFLAIFTSASFYVSMLTADIFTAYIYLVIFIMIFHKGLSKTEYILLGVLLLYSIITHNSHILILVIVISSLLIYWFVGKFICKYEFGKLSTFVRVGIIIVVSFLMLPLLNYMIDGRFRISDSTHIFLMHKLHDDNILVKYLNENCLQHNNFLCEQKDSLPWDIIWDPKSPLTKDGDWSKYKLECNLMIRDILTTFPYSKMFFLKAIHQSLAQFFNFNTGDIPTTDAMLEPPTSAINEHFKFDIREYLSSRLFNKRLTFERINTIQFYSVYFSMMLILLYCLIRTSDQGKLSKAAIMFLIIFLFSNAFVCATFSNVLERYQSRVIFLIPLVAIVVFPQVFKAGIKLWIHATGRS